MNKTSCSFTTNSNSHVDLDKNLNINDLFPSQVSRVPKLDINGSYCSEMLPQQVRKIGTKRKSCDFQVHVFDKPLKS